mgnify:CR=1 FL=1
MRILITGATGFIGSSLVLYLSSKGYSLIIASRKVSDIMLPNIMQVMIGEITSETDWAEVFKDKNIDVVIHLAARVHVMQETTTEPLEEFRQTNTAGTLSLARQAATAGVSRFILLSSIKVNGERTTADKPFTADDTRIPTDPYGISKYEAEQGLRELAVQTGMEVVIIRPPLVYGPGVKANFLSMMRWLHKGIPLPLGAIHNQRSLVALDNLVDLITTCIDHPAAANQAFLVSDGEDLSTSALLQRLGHGLGKPACLLPIPQNFLTSSLNLLGKGEIAQRLCGSLQIDMSKTRELLTWVPPVTVDEALYKTAQAYLASKRREI